MPRRRFQVDAAVLSIEQENCERAKPVTAINSITQKHSQAGFGICPFGIQVIKIYSFPALNSRWPADIINIRENLIDWSQKYIEQ